MFVSLCKHGTHFPRNSHLHSLRTTKLCYIDLESLATAIPGKKLAQPANIFGSANRFSIDFRVAGLVWFMVLVSPHLQGRTMHGRQVFLTTTFDFIASTHHAFNILFLLHKQFNSIPPLLSMTSNPDFNDKTTATEVAQALGSSIKGKNGSSLSELAHFGHENKMFSM